MPNQYKKINIVDCKELAKSKNGKFLSTNYINANKKLQWECEFGHKFELAWKHIQYYKSWCSQCNSNIGEEICRFYLEAIFDKSFVSIRPDWLKYSKYNLQLDGYCSELNIAFEHNGSQHNKKHPYFHVDKSSLEKQIDRDTFKINKCKELKIKLIIIPELFRDIKLNELMSFIVDKCNKLKINLPPNINKINIDLSKINNVKNKLSHYKNLAIKNNGECLSNTYINFHEPLDWRCNKNHRWSAPGYSIEYGTWCPYCVGLKKLSIEDAHFVALQKGGLCISKEYLSARKKLDWKCDQGHIWSATMASVRNLGTWCPKCRVRRRKITERVS